MIWSLSPPTGLSKPLCALLSVLENFHLLSLDHLGVLIEFGGGISGPPSLDMLGLTSLICMEDFSIRLAALRPIYLPKASKLLWGFSGYQSRIFPRVSMQVPFSKTHICAYFSLLFLFSPSPIKADKP